MLEEIRRRLQARDFIPFIIRSADGREFHVLSRDHAWVPAGGGRVYVAHDDGYADLVSDLLIASVHAKDADAGVLVS